ncbi:hypothetical protein CPC08DRAFT_705477, partial [Agrocybe pediades]
MAAGFTFSAPSPKKSPRFFASHSGTIRDIEGSAKKRRRTEVDDDEGAYGPAHKRSNSAPDTPVPPRRQRDPEFFRAEEDATCYIQIKDVVFKIHRSLIGCAPLLAQMADEHFQRHGSVEEKPLSLILPKLDEFRAFLWVVYIPDDQLGKYKTPQEFEEVERLFCIARMTEKYDIPGVRDWVIAAIQNATSNKALMDALSSANLAYMVDQCYAHKFHMALAAVVSKWYDRLEKKEAPSVPAVQVADKYNLDELKGMAYYMHVQDMIDRQTTTDKGATHLIADPKLNQNQVLRLLKGYFSLVSMWERLRQKPVQLPMGSSCTEDKHCKCIAFWEKRWTSSVGWKRILAINSADVLASLACLRDQLMNDEEMKKPGAMDPECRLAGLEAIKKLRLKTRAELADHF